MNFFFFFIVIFLVLSWALELLSETLNLRNFSTALPPEFEGLYDPDRYRKSLEYQQAHTRLDTFRSTLVLIALIAFWVAGGFERVDQFARAFGLGSIGTGLTFIATLSLLRMGLTLPFSIYSTFVVEERFGFNKTTVRTFVSDLIKGLILGAILGGLALSGVLYFFEKVGQLAWLYSWIALTVLQVLLSYLAPAILMPLFNKFEPLPEGALKSEIERYAKSRNFRLSGIFTMDGSKRSTKANAFFTGFGRFRRLVLFDTLVQKQTPEELVAVIAHEIGHFERRHIIKGLILSILTTGLMFFGLSLFLNRRELFEAFRMSNVSVYASLVFVSFLYGPALKLLSIFTHSLSRKYEFEADEFAVKTYGNGEKLISALRKLSVDSMSHLTPHWLKILLEYTHPPVLQRIQAIRNRSS